MKMATIIAKTAEIKVAAAPKSLACLAKGCSSEVAKSTALSIAELKISQMKTKQMAAVIHSHSDAVRSK